MYGARSTQFTLQVHSGPQFQRIPQTVSTSTRVIDIDEHATVPALQHLRERGRGAVVPTLSRHLICMYILVHPFRRASCIRLAVKCLGSTPVKLACPPYLARTQRPKSARGVSKYMRNFRRGTAACDLFIDRRLRRLRAVSLAISRGLDWEKGETRK